MKNEKEKQPELFGHRKGTSAKETKKKRGEETWTKQVTEQNCGRKVKYIYTHAHIYIYINAIFRKKGRGRKLSLK